MLALHGDLSALLMILVPVSEVHPATSHPPAIPDPVGVGPGDRKWAMTGRLPPPSAGPGRAWAGLFQGLRLPHEAAGGCQDAR